MAARQAAAGLEITGFLVQRMVPEGVEMIVGVVQDPVFGPGRRLGAGGTAVELMKDVSVRLAPLTEAEAERMLRSLANFPLLDGYRGSPRVDMDSLTRLLMQVSARGTGPDRTDALPNAPTWPRCRPADYYPWVGEEVAEGDPLAKLT